MSAKLNSERVSQISIKELIHKIRGRKTWRETGLTVNEVLEVLVEAEASKEAPTKDEAVAVAELYQQIEEKDKIIDNLRETNRKQRSELKKLRAEKG